MELICLAGMQRFGTASIPTHSIGLALLRSDWAGAISLILRPRPGEYPEADAARRAWLDDRDLERALSLMPRRVVAERCILENYKKQGGDDRNALGAISTVCHLFFLIHAYERSLLDSKESPSDVYTCIPIVCMECHRLGANKGVWTETDCRRPCL